MTDARLQLAATVAQLAPVLFLAIVLEQRALPAGSRLKNKWVGSLLLGLAGASEFGALLYLVGLAFPEPGAREDQVEAAQRFVEVALQISMAATFALVFGVLLLGATVLTIYGRGTGGRRGSIHE